MTFQGCTCKISKRNPFCAVHGVSYEKLTSTEESVNTHHTIPVKPKILADLAAKAFIKKWNTPECRGWDDHADRLYWARTYKMEGRELVEISKDFLVLYQTGGSSTDKARQVLGIPWNVKIPVCDSREQFDAWYDAWYASLKLTT